MDKPEAIKTELQSIISEGKTIHSEKQASLASAELIRRGKKDPETLAMAKNASGIQSRYQKWYTLSLPIIQQLLPDRYIEFQECYRPLKQLAKKREHTISDYFSESFISWGHEADWSVFLIKFQIQIDILESALARFDSVVANIKGVLQAEIFDNEILAARELLKKGHLRASGTLAGVVIERHLNQVIRDHRISLIKRDPSIGDLNDLLKNEGLIDIPTWRFIQRLGDIRNLCAHAKDREPKVDEVQDLLQGADKIVKTIF